MKVRGGVWKHKGTNVLSLEEPFHVLMLMDGFLLFMHMLTNENRFRLKYRPAFTQLGIYE